MPTLSKFRFFLGRKVSGSVTFPRRLFCLLLAGTAFLSFHPLNAQKSDTEREKELDSIRKRLEHNPYDAELLKNAWLLESGLGNFHKVAEECRRVYPVAVRNADAHLALLASVMAGQSFVSLNLADSIRLWLQNAFYWSSQTDEDWAEAALYNIAGIHAIDHEANYVKGISYFINGQRLMENDTSRIYYILTANLALACNFRNDTSGLSYARIVYQQGRKKNDDFLRLTGSLICADLYLLKGQYDSALKYANEALPLAQETSTRCQAYRILGSIMDAGNQPEKARAYYLKALENSHNPDIIATMELFLDYGRFLLENGETGEAIRYFRQANRLAKARKGFLYRYQIYFNLAEAYRASGNYAQALLYYDSSHTESVKLFNIEKEQSMNELRIRYQVETKEREIHRQEMAVAKANQKIYLLAACLLVVLLIAGGAWYLYLRRTKMYRKIVQQYHEFSQTEKRYVSTLKAGGNAVLDSTSGTQENVGANAKEWELFKRVEQLMRTRYLYRDSSLTIEKLASLIGTNRTYLSMALNHCARTSFNGYVNQLRIQEAIGILSDPSDDTPLKDIGYQVGFNTISTFYRAFQSIVNVPPSRFREENRKLLVAARKSGNNSHAEVTGTEGMPKQNF